MPPKRIWLVDGHNVIFGIPSLQQLQVTDRREEARSKLAGRLERFALARSEKVHLVFDGNELPSNPDAIDTPLFETVYTRRGEESADDRIVRVATRCLDRGLVVTVVTDDVRTLASELPRGVRRLGVREFWLKHIEKDPGRDDKRVEGDFSDVERELLTRAAQAEPVFAVRESATTARPRAGGEEAARADALREALRRKREKGQQRHKRRLERRATPGRRRPG